MKRSLLSGLVLAQLTWLAACSQPGASQDAPSAAPDVEAVANASADAPAVVAAPPPSPAQPQAAQPAPATGAYTPASGSPERTALMNALRPKVSDDLGGEPMFVVNNLRSNGQWAFGELEPQWRDGRPINIEHTPISHNEAIMDGLTIQAIWRNQNGRWTVFAHAIGATDVWWVEHCGRVPASVMRGC